MKSSIGTGLISWFDLQRLRNPKVEKAAILESVVQFLRAEQSAGETASGPQPTGSGAANSLREEVVASLPAECNANYREGVRMCLRRVGHFIAAKSRELEGSMDGAGGHQNPLEHAGPLPQSVIPLPLSKPPSKTRILAADTPLPRRGPQPAPEQVLGHGVLDPSAHVPPQRLSPCPLPSYPLEVLPKPGGATGDAVWRPWPQ